LSATIGEIRYFSTQKVGLPAQPIDAASTGQTLGDHTGVNPLALPGQALVNSRGPDSHGSTRTICLRAALPKLRAGRRGDECGQTVFPASDIVADVAVTAVQALQLQF